MSNADCMEERVSGLCSGRAGALGPAKGQGLDLGRSQKEHELITGQTVLLQVYPIPLPRYPSITGA